MYDALKIGRQLPLIDDLRWDSVKKEMIPCKRQVFYFTDDRGFLYISAEDGAGLADYYGEFKGGYPWIHPDLEAFADDMGMYWEWANPGVIMLCD